MEKREFNAVLYLYNGDAQPEIISVASEEEVLRWAGQFERTRIEIPGAPPVWLKLKKQHDRVTVSADDVVPELVDSPVASGAASELVVDRVGYGSIRSSIFYDGWKTRK